VYEPVVYIYTVICTPTDHFFYVMRVQGKTKIAVNRPKTTRVDWKPTKIPNGFYLQIDTREQQPFFIRHRINKGETRIVDIGNERLLCIGETLHNGDYAVAGMPLCVERKQLSDFFSYIGVERKKTVEKLERLRDQRWSGLVVEADENDLYMPQMYGGSITPEQVRGFLVSCSVRYGVHVYMNRDRTVCERWVLDRLVKGYNVMRETG